MRTVVDNLRPMLGDHFQAKDELCPSHLCTSSGTSTATSAAVATAVRTMPSSCSLFAETHHQVTVGSGAEDTGSHQHLILPSSLQHNQQQQQHQLAYQSGHAIRYYPPLMEHYGGGSSLHRYSSLNQKRESVITFSSNHSAPQSHPLKNAYLESLDLEEDKPRIASLLHSTSAHLHYKHKYKGSQVVINNTTYTIDQIVCICQVLQKSDLHKLEKFVYNLPADDSKLSKNELILRARAIAAYHAANYKEVYDILETHNFNMKYHQELQNLWNNAHYKEHEMKRGHPPGAVEKYRIRKKFQFPRTIWDGEEYVYCFKEKNRRILKEFYLKCNLPTQEDKLKLSSQTQLTVVQISNWFKNRRQRDRQPSNHDHDKTSSDAQSNLTNDSSNPATPSPPISSLSSLNNSQSFSVSESLVSALSQQQQQQSHHHHQHGVMSTGEDSFCLLTGSTSAHSQASNAHRSYYFLPQ